MGVGDGAGQGGCLGGGEADLALGLGEAGAGGVGDGAAPSGEAGGVEDFGLVAFGQALEFGADGFPGGGGLGEEVDVPG
ncbi:hypothetical protein ACWGR4_46070 [Embleya sp. NPDC055664]